MTNSCNNRRRIGILTYHRAENYGSALQAYALNAAIRDMAPENTEVHTIDYIPPAQQRLYHIFQPTRGIMDLARNIHSLAHCRSLRKKKRHFNSFISRNIPLSPFHGTDKARIIPLLNEYDILICGSDQIWNMNCFDFDRIYTLHGIHGPAKIAYAPSLGLSRLSSEQEKTLLNDLSEFSRIATREPTGASYLSALLKRQVFNTCDPTMLISKQRWLDIANQADIKIPDKGYILSYFIGNIDGMRQFSARISRESGMKEVVIIKNLRDICSGRTRRLDAGPAEFISLIANAGMVITDSFHATIFSLIFHRPFWVFTDVLDNSKPNARIMDILSMAGMPDRMLTPDTHARADRNAPLDFADADRRLATYINQSRQWLSDALSL